MIEKSIQRRIKINMDECEIVIWTDPLDFCVYSRANNIDRRPKIDRFRGGIVQVDHAQGHERIRSARLEFEKSKKSKIDVYLYFKPNKFLFRVYIF